MAIYSVHKYLLMVDYYIPFRVPEARQTKEMENSVLMCSDSHD